jgi:hypothetical protein
MSLAIDKLDYAMSEVAHWEEYMQQQSVPVDVEELKKEIKKLNARATELKMNLHDLAEDLPTGWEKIPEVAEKAYQAYKSLTEARGQLSGAGG